MLHSHFHNSTSPKIIKSKSSSMAFSNKLTAFLNFIAFMCSIPVISTGIWIASKPDNECIHWLRWPLVFLGLAVSIVSLMGFVGAHWKREGLLGLYLACMFILIALLLALLVMAFAVTRPSGAHDVPGAGFEEYRLEGFSRWLRDHVAGGDSWGRIRACLVGSRICPEMARRYASGAEFFQSSLSPTESGCCKPPTMCGFRYSGPTTWTGPSDAGADAECGIWSNDPSQLCYDCDACKAGLLGNLRHEWRKADVIVVISVVVLICVYLVGCVAYRNAQTEGFFRRYKRGWV